VDGVESLITVAEDCPVQAGVAPTGWRGALTVAQVQHGLLAGDPFRFTEDDVLFESWFRRQQFPQGPPDTDGVRTLREAFLAKQRPCLRASPLPMRFGWGLASDGAGRLALCAVESPEYRELTAPGSGVRLHKAFRSRGRRHGPTGPLRGA
jgi:hypothetical protein